MNRKKSFGGGGMMKRKKRRANKRAVSNNDNPFEDLFFWLQLASANFAFVLYQGDTECTANMPIIKNEKEPL